MSLTRDIGSILVTKQLSQQEIYSLEFYLIHLYVTAYNKYINTTVQKALV